MEFIKKIFGGNGEKEALAMEQPTTPPSPSEPEPEPLQINEVTPQELKAWLDNGDELVVVDMRSAWEYQAGHIPGATHMFIQEIPARFNELPKDKDVVFQCWHGNTSLDASGFLIQNGWDASKVFSLSGGIAGWSSTFGQDALAKD